MKTLGINSLVPVQDIYNGGLCTMSSNKASLDITNHARNIVEEIFGCKISEINHDNNLELDYFVDRASKVKTKFTDGKDTEELTRELIKSRYDLNLVPYMLFDKPRLRIIPNSNFLSSGISYNYKPHRDTWYGGTLDQINHWMTLYNVTPDTSFYIAPGYFSRPVDNNSQVFDLDNWDTKFRKQASNNVKAEDRPHPLPLQELPEDDRLAIVLPEGAEVVFSSNHFHGSGPNNTNLVRFSIDYRTAVIKEGFKFPVNVDNRATGDLKKYMLKV